jgi:hypothetical protein
MLVEQRIVVWFQIGARQRPRPNKLVKPSGGSGGFYNQWFLAAADSIWMEGCEEVT